MAPRRKTIAPARRVATRRIRRRRNRKQRSSPSTGSLIVRGVNALLSAVPAAKIFSPITDFLFKSVGFASTAITLPTTAATSVIYGMGAAFAVPLSAIIENASMIPKHHSGNHVQLYTNFTHGQLLNIRVTVRPIGELAHRQGNLAVAFIPYSTQESSAYYTQNIAVPTLQDVLIVPNAVQGSGTQTLSVNYRARGQSFCCLPHPLTTDVGLVLIGYQDLSRNKGTEFGAEDFGAEVIVSGAVKLSNPLPHVGYDAVSCAVSDKLAPFVARVGDFSVSNGKCEEYGLVTKITGTFTPVTYAQRKDEHLGRDVPYGSPSSMISMLEDASLNTA